MKSYICNVHIQKGERGSVVKVEGVSDLKAPLDYSYDFFSLLKLHHLEQLE